MGGWNEDCGGGNDGFKGEYCSRKREQKKGGVFTARRYQALGPRDAGVLSITSWNCCSIDGAMVLEC